MGGRRQADVWHDADNPMPIPEGAFAEEERLVIQRVLTLASRSLRGIMTPRGEISWVDADLRVDEIRERLALFTAVCVSRYVAVNWMKSSVLYVLKNCWWRWKRALMWRRLLRRLRRLSSRKPSRNTNQPVGRAACVLRGGLCYRDRRVGVWYKAGHAAGCAGSH
ncbi:hypothetical protein ACNKHU_08475 [Shigella flexneri]